jgi:hypothetical protein
MDTYLTDRRIELLLVDADDLEPAIRDGLPTEALEGAPMPAPDPDLRGVKRKFRENPGESPNNLEAQRWGVVAPAGPAGDRMLEAIAPLIRLREREQDAPARVYRVAAGMSAAEASRWREREYLFDGTPEEERPRYLLLLGDLDEVSIEFQHVLGSEALVGRAHFSTEDGAPDLRRFEAYAHKVVRFAQREPTGAASPMLFFTASDQTAATSIAHTSLVSPCISLAQKLGASESSLLDVREAECSDAGVRGLLDAAAAAEQGVLLSVSHGLGAPRRGWASAAQQRAKQGALSMGSGEVLSAEALQGARFLPGGMWFCLACFGAGTPRESAFHRWLSVLAERGAYEGRPSDVLRSLPKPGERPFVAALPQAALANPEGPLAVIGHVDLAWTYSFVDEASGESRASRIFSVLKALSRRSRAGVAMSALARHYRAANEDLMANHEADLTARPPGAAAGEDAARRAHTWMRRNDLRGYVLLGDPAARLPPRPEPA